jgi:hypothetical protein
MTSEKHLDYLQAIITRHNTNSFMLKGWAITLLSALLALSGAIKEPNISLVAIMPILIFWCLDTFYLSNERCFVDLFNAAVKGEYEIPKKKTLKKDFKVTNENSEKDIIKDFDMNFMKFKIWKDNTWWTVFRSKTILWYYLPLCIITFGIWQFQQNCSSFKSKPIEINANIKPSTLEIKSNPTIINQIDTCKHTTIKKN